jgi:hypothetical protein
VTIKTSKFDEDQRSVESSTALDNKENLKDRSRNVDKVKQIPSSSSVSSSSSLSSSSVSSSVMGMRNRENNDLISTIDPQISKSTSREEIEGVKSLTVIKDNYESDISRPVKGTLGIKQIWVHVKHRLLVMYKYNIGRYHIVTSSEFFHEYLNFYYHEYLLLI